MRSTSSRLHMALNMRHPQVRGWFSKYRDWRRKSQWDWNSPWKWDDPLVGGFKYGCYFPFHICSYHPPHWLIFFKMGTLHHQPAPVFLQRFVRLVTYLYSQLPGRSNDHGTPALIQVLGPGGINRCSSKVQGYPNNLRSTGISKMGASWGNNMQQFYVDIWIYTGI